MQNTSSAVMSQRVEPPDSLDFYPTPPWATRALCERLNSWGYAGSESCWEPACGAGDMAKPLAEYFARVEASDCHDYGFGDLDDFLLPGPARHDVDWIITNPPFRLAEQFVRRAFEIATGGVAMLVRTAWLEGVGRHERLFEPSPPEWILQFTERVPMFKGRLDPQGSTATAYCWVIWMAQRSCVAPTLAWIPPCRKRLERDGDYDWPDSG